METLTSPFRKNSLMQFNPHEIYLTTIQWLSELEFSKTELTLLSKLLDKSFMNQQLKHDYDELLLLDKKVKLFLNSTHHEMQSKIAEHEKHFLMLDENIFSQHEQSISDEHLEVSRSLRYFRNELKQLKDELLDFVEAEWKQATTRNFAL